MSDAASYRCRRRWLPIGFLQRKCSAWSMRSSSRNFFIYNLLQNRDGGIRTRDPLNPMAERRHRLYSTKSVLRGEPGFRAGVSQHANCALTGETDPETDTDVGSNRRRTDPQRIACRSGASCPRPMTAPSEGRHLIPLLKRQMHLRMVSTELTTTQSVHAPVVTASTRLGLMNPRR